MKGLANAALLMALMLIVTFSDVLRLITGKGLGASGRKKAVFAGAFRRSCGGAKISVQSMLNVPASDVEGSVAQAVALEQAGCDIIRAAIPNMEAISDSVIGARRQFLCPDIHFDYHY